MVEPVDKISVRGGVRPERDPDDISETVLSGVQKQILAMFCWCLLQNGKIQPAATVLTVLYQIDPQRIDTVQMLCYASLKMADYATALSLSERLAGLDTQERVINAANLLKSRALWGLGRQDEAKALMIETIKRKRMHDVQNIE